MNASPSEIQGHPAAAENPDDSRYLVYGRVAEQIHADLQAGRPPEVEALIDQHPQLADEIRQLASAQVMLHELGHAPGDPSAGAGPAPTGADVLGQLGDFRIQGEIGRGGMGVVYEAQQISLRRRVALKVLPFAAVLDPKHLQRFKNEAQAAASLRHPNIVQVFSVGCERGVHYYAMDYIEGQTLAEVIHQRRGVAGVERSEPPESQPQSNRGLAPLDPSHPTDSPPHPVTDTSPLAALSTETSPRDPEFFRTIARLGIQAAEALEHAHTMGVVHRDVKPSNLMVDAAGHLWITDFGLAMTQTDTNLTMTGDLLGTLRYMSPEQVQAKHGVLDHRTDIYSLGLTLYELLTLQPAFGGDDRQKLLRQVAEDDPRPPRQVNQAIPRDLETIILKATAKEPQDRYATAQQLANDLGRFLEDQTIRARRPTLRQRAAKWSRRHKWGLSTAIAVAFLVTLACGGFFWHGKNREARQRQLAEENFQLGLEAVNQISTEYVAGQQYQSRAKTLERGELLHKLLAFYEQFVHANPSDLSVRRNMATVYARLAQVQDQLGTHQKAEATWQLAIDVAQELASQAPGDPDCRKCLADVYSRRGESYWKSGEYDRAIETCDEAIRIWPEHAKAFDSRGFAFFFKGNWERSIADFNQQIRLLPKFAWAYRNRGWSYLGRDLDQTIADCTKAIELDPRLAMAYSTRANAYAKKGEFDNAIDDHNKAIELFWSTASECDPFCYAYYTNRGHTYLKEDNLEKAIADFHMGSQLASQSASALNEVAWLLVSCADVRIRRPQRAVELAAEAVRLSPNEATIWSTLGAAQYRVGNPQAAVEALKKSEELKYYRCGATWFFRAMAHWQLDQKEEARRWYGKAVEWTEKNDPEDEELRRFRAEAAELLKIENEQPE